jgi:hypothetical protein
MPGPSARRHDVRISDSDQEQVCRRSVDLTGRIPCVTGRQPIESATERAGAYVLGRRMFDEGGANWPEEAPFHAPTFLVTQWR